MLLFLHGAYNLLRMYQFGVHEKRATTTTTSAVVKRSDGGKGMSLPGLTWLMFLLAMVVCVLPPGAVTLVQCKQNAFFDGPSQVIYAQKEHQRADSGIFRNIRLNFHSSKVFFSKFQKNFKKRDIFQIKKNL